MLKSRNAARGVEPTPPPGVKRAWFISHTICRNVHGSSRIRPFCRKSHIKIYETQGTYIREVEVRSQASFSDEYVINVIRTIDGEEEYDMDFINKGFDDYRFLIVMTVGDRSLAAVIASGNIAGKGVIYYVITYHNPSCMISSPLPPSMLFVIYPYLLPG